MKLILRACCFSVFAQFGCTPAHNPGMVLVGDDLEVSVAKAQAVDSPPVDDVGCEPAYLSFTAFYQTGSVVHYNDIGSEIDALAEHLLQNPDADAEIAALTDTVGDARLNRLLADRRAQGIKDLLLQRGVHARQICVKAIGEADDVAGRADPNNRVVKVSALLAPPQCRGMGQASCEHSKWNGNGLYKREYSPERYKDQLPPLEIETPSGRVLLLPPQ
ncbi:MAG: OmpA family protein [Methylobacter sp.]